MKIQLWYEEKENGVRHFCGQKRSLDTSLIFYADSCPEEMKTVAIVETEDGKEYIVEIKEF